MVNKNFLYRFLKSKYGKRLSSGGTDSQTFVMENLLMTVAQMTMRSKSTQLHAACVNMVKQSDSALDRSVVYFF